MTGQRSDLDAVQLPFTGVRSLAFQGGVLLDWVAGGRVLGLDGTERGGGACYGDAFDSAVVCPSGRHVVVYERLGTRAALVDPSTGRVVRAVRRCAYHASAYAFPVALWVAGSGHSLLAHCPDEHDRLEIDDLDTGERLTACDARDPWDTFHSHLAVNPSGTRLLSAGWVWHPWHVVGWVDLPRALSEPTLLDRPRGVHSSLNVGLAEEANAAWQTDDHLLIGSSDEPEDADEVAELGDALRLVSPGLAVVDVRTATVVQSVPLPHPPGAMLPVGRDEVVTFYEHPRLYRLADGQLVQEWPDLPTGKLAGSILGHLPAPPPMAIDAAGVRFAVATRDGVAVVDLGARVDRGSWQGVTGRGLGRRARR